MINEQDWIGAYLELCDILKAKVNEVQHLDLWYDQLNYEKEEYLYPEKAVFFEFNVQNTEAIGLKVQDMNTLIRVIYAFDTYSDTFKDSDNQAVALSFGETARKIHKYLQGISGKNFSSLNRIGLQKVEAPEGCIAYAQIYSCIIRDYSAMDETETTQLQNVTVGLENGGAEPPEDFGLFDVQMG